MPPLVGFSTPHSGGALPSLPCVRGGAARSAAEGLFLTQTIFFFFPANSTLLQSLRRSRASSLYWGEPFVCANIAKKFCCFRRAGAYGMPPYGIRFCRSSSRPLVAPARGIPLCLHILRSWRLLPAATHVCPPVWRIAWSGAGAPKVACLLFPASPASLQTPPDGAEFAQNRQIPDRKAYIVRRGRVLAIENGKIKETRHKPGFFLRFCQGSTFFGSIAYFPGTCFLRKSYFRFRSARILQAGAPQNLRRIAEIAPRGVFHTPRGDFR